MCDKVINEILDAVEVVKNQSFLRVQALGVHFVLELEDCPCFRKRRVALSEQESQGVGNRGGHCVCMGGGGGRLTIQS